MRKCEKCEEELNEGWDVCWKCSHNHNKETITPKESSIKTGDDTSVLLNLTKDNVTVQKIEHLSSLSVILMVLSICGSFYYIFEYWKDLSFFHIGGVVLTSGVWCYFLLGITRLVESVIYLYEKQQS